MLYIQYNWLYSLIGIVIYFIMLCISRPDITYKGPKHNNVNKGITLFFFLYTFNSIYGLWEWDTYHIWDAFIFAGQYYNFEIDGYEAVFNWLASITGDNYWLWRFIVWTPACLFMYFSAKRLSLLNRNFLVSLALFGGFLAFTRGMLGHAMLIYGIIIFGCSHIDNKAIGRIIGLIIIVASYFFHKSIYINIIFAVLALIPFGKNLIKISIPFFPIAVVLASMTVDYILAGEVDVAYGEGVGGIGDRTLDYLEKEKTELTLYGYIGKAIELLPVYFTVYYLYNRIHTKKYFSKIKYDSLFKYLYRLTYVAFYISSAYLFTGASEWISSRFMYMSYFPLVFVLGRVWSIEPKTNIQLKLIITLQLLAIAYKYLNQLKDWYTL